MAAQLGHGPGVFVWHNNPLHFDEVLASPQIHSNANFILLPNSSTIWNPVLYALLNEQFRTAFSEQFKQLRLCLAAKEMRRPAMAYNKEVTTTTPRRSSTRLMSNPTMVFTPAPLEVDARKNANIGLLSGKINGNGCRVGSH